MAVCLLFCSLAGCGIENVDQYEPTVYTAPAEILFHGYAITDLNIYTQPDENSEICGKLSLGDYFHIEQIQGNWCKISDGWIPLEGISYREIDTAWPAIMEGYVKPQKTTIWEKPNSDASSTTTYYNGDSVLICLVAGQWGLTKDGWVYMDHINITKTYDEDDYQTNAPQNEDPQTTVPQQTEDTDSTQDMSHLLVGTWYSYRTFDNSKSYYVYCKEFRNGMVIDSDFYYYPENGRKSSNGYTEGFYSFDGKKVWIDCPPYTDEGGNTYSIRVSGNNLYWQWGSEESLYQRVSWETIKAQIDKEYNGTGTIDPAIIGNWYRIGVSTVNSKEGFVNILHFDADGSYYDQGFLYNVDYPSTDDSMGGEWDSTYTYSNNTVTQRFSDGTTYSYTAKVNGDTLTLIQYGSTLTYKRGTKEDGFRELIPLLEGSEPTSPTEPTTEPVVEEDYVSVNAVMDYLTSLYYGQNKATSQDFERYSEVRVGGEAFNVVWTVSQGEDVVKVVPGGDSTVIIDINEQHEPDTPYILTATVVDRGGNSLSYSWNYYLP